MDKMVGDIEYNKTAQTKSFRWRESPSSPMHQVTYDDKETYTLKYKWALESGFRGIGFWMVRVLQDDTLIRASVARLQGTIHG